MPRELLPVRLKMWLVIFIGKILNDYPQVNRRLQILYANDTEASGSQSGILTKDERLRIYDDIVREVCYSSYLYSSARK